MMRNRRRSRHFYKGLASMILLLTFAVLWSQPAKTVGDTRSYVVSCDTNITLLTLPETAPEELVSQCGYDPEEYIISTTEHDSYTAVTLHKALDVTVSADGEERGVRTTGGTVGELLEKLAVTLNEDDTITYNTDTPIEDGMLIRICRVTYGEAYEEEPIPHDTEYRDSSELYKGTEETVTEGSDGLAKLTYRVKYIDGAESERELMSRETVTEPVNTVIARGTKVKETPKPAPSTTGNSGTPSTGTTSGSGGGNSETPSGGGDRETSSDGGGTITTASGEVLGYSRCITMKATAYSYEAGSITSSGAPVQVGIVAALPRTLPPGTRVYIVTVDGAYTYGPAIVGDTPGSDIIDLFYETVEECYQFGVRNAYVYILN